MTELATAALERFVDALNLPRDLAALGAAVIDDVRVVRYAPGEVGATPIVETFTGISELAQWFARTPPIVRFSIAGAVEPEAAGWRIEYAIDAGEFHNGGIWVATLAGDGRIAQLSHHPFALREAPRTHEASPTREAPHDHAHEPPHDHAHEPPHDHAHDHAHEPPHDPAHASSEPLKS